MPTRAVTILGVIQVGALCACYLAAAAFLRISEKWDPDIHWLQSTGWYRLLAFVRFFAWVLFAIPVLMTVFCGRLTRSHRDVTWLGPDGIWLAVSVTAVTVLFCAFTMLTAFGGPPSHSRWH